MDADTLTDIVEIAQAITRLIQLVSRIVSAVRYTRAAMQKKNRPRR